MAALSTVAIFLTVALSGCGDATLKAQQQQVQQQQQQIEQQQQEIESLKQQAPSYTPGLPSAPGGCDRATEQAATQHGGSDYAAGSYEKALAYYKDALSACPADPKAEINVARAYEAMGNRDSAVEHYRAAASSSDASAPGAIEEARNALVRLGAGAP
ncbi:MAG TPA: tetratricopeptide repeat protein [Candidatus Binataceae bacterium]|nr:tetratricopeptide repeat protein [Candidatus Binataceae bacterium]